MIGTSFKVYVYLFRTYAAWEENIPVCPNAEHEQRRLLQEYCSKFEIYRIPDPLTIPKQNWIPEVEGITKWPSVYYIQWHCQILKSSSTRIHIETR